MASSRSSGSPETTDRLVIGVFVGHFGVRGEVRLKPFTDFPERIPGYEYLIARLPSDEERVLTLERARRHKALWVLKFQDVDCLEAAEKLRGAEAMIEMEQAQPLPAGRYYDHQILGLRIVTCDGEELGNVREIIHVGPNDVYAVGQRLIPATHDAILELDPEGGKIVVRERAYLDGVEVR